VSIWAKAGTRRARLIAVLAAAGGALAMAGCGEKSEPAVHPPTTATPTTPATTAPTTTAPTGTQPAPGGTATAPQRPKK
jgi:hypothetical protein